jgi:hypothetical protein
MTNTKAKYVAVEKTNAVNDYVTKLPSVQLIVLRS